MPDINLDVNYFDRPDVKRLVGLLGRGAEVLPLKLWTYTAKVRAQDGRLIAHVAQEIESITGWWGKSGEMVRVMLLKGIEFLEQEPDGTYVVRNWCDDQGHVSAFHDRAKKAAQARWQKIRDGSNATSMPQACLKHSPKPTGSKNNSRSRVSGYPKPAGAGAALGPAAVALRSELAAVGIGEPSLSRCAAVPGLTPVAVLLMAEEAEKEADENPAGWMVSRILAANFKPPEMVQPEALARISNAGDVVSICGHPVDGKVTFSNHWIEIGPGRTRLNADQLRAEAIELPQEDGL